MKKEQEVKRKRKLSQADDSNEAPLPKKSRDEEIDDDIMKMLAQTNNPFSFVENSFFAKVIKKAYPDFKLKKRQHFSTIVLPRVASEIIDRLSSQVADNFIAITTDGWSAQHKPSPSFYR